MPPPPPDPNSTVLVDGNKEVLDEAVAAAAAAVVDASVTAPTIGNVVQTTLEQTAAAAQIAASLVIDPISRSYSDIEDDVNGFPIVKYET